MAGKKKQKKAELTLTVAPVSGAPTTRAVEVPKPVALGTLLKAEGVETKKRDLLVNSQPATTKTVVKAGDKVEAMERPAGS